MTASVISVTPFFSHSLNSLVFILLEAFVISGVFMSLPAQNSFIPPPEPVDSTTGVGYLLVAPNSSATAEENGYTVEDPTILI